MKKIVAILVFSILGLSIIKAQDTIFVKKGNSIETVLCKITKVTSMNIFYTENKIGKSISTNEVYRFINSTSNQLPKIAVSSAQQNIQGLTVKPIKTGERWFVLSGMAIIASGICSIISANLKLPSNPSVTDTKDYATQQQNLQKAQGIANIIAGGSLLVGVTIHFK